MPGESSVNFGVLHRICKLVVLLCFLHIAVTVVFYVRSYDFRLAFVQNQQSSNNIPKIQNNNPVVTSGLEPAKDGDKVSEEGEVLEQPVKKLEKCPETSPLLVGPLRVEFNIPVNLELIKKENPNVQPGGRFKPKDCEALQKVAIIIPFRNREEHLKYWLYYLHPILQRQQLDYGIYVINQDGDETFNRAKLLNIGYAEALKEYDYNCFVFSDVDLIPMDDRNTYKCFSQPRHLSVSMDKFGFRVASKGMSISRATGEIGKCRMIRHNRDKMNDPNPQRFNRIAHTRETMYKDGINSLNYQVVSIQKLDLFTMITVDVGKP
ncbi:beta-1,4-galactosyltransferase 1 [Pundamilia nyererei]|nr:PREDICTED: beta-1,4-galactosyltransferase 1 [Pundamilia nyererei]